MTGMRNAEHLCGMSGGMNGRTIGGRRYEMILGTTGKTTAETLAFLASEPIRKMTENHEVALGLEIQETTETRNETARVLHDPGLNVEIDPGHDSGIDERGAVHGIDTIDGTEAALVLELRNASLTAVSGAASVIETGSVTLIVLTETGIVSVTTEHASPTMIAAIETETGLGIAIERRNAPLFARVALAHDRQLPWTARSWKSGSKTRSRSASRKLRPILQPKNKPARKGCQSQVSTSPFLTGLPIPSARTSRRRSTVMCRPTASERRNAAP